MRSYADFVKEMVEADVAIAPNRKVATVEERCSAHMSLNAWMAAAQAIGRIEREGSTVPVVLVMVGNDFAKAREVWRALPAGVEHSLRASRQGGAPIRGSLLQLVEPTFAWLKQRQPGYACPSEAIVLEYLRTEDQRRNI